MKFEVEIDNEKIAEIVRGFARETFSAAGSSNGYRERDELRAIRSEVNRQVSALDFNAMIAHECKRAAESVIAEVTATAIRDAAKRTVKAMEKTGELFAGVKP